MGAVKKKSFEYGNILEPGRDLKGAIWWFLYLHMLIIDITEQQGKWREGLSHLTFLTNKGRERDRERKKKNSAVSLSYFGIKFQPKETQCPEKQLVPQHRQGAPTSVWLDSASRGDTPLGFYEDPFVKESASFYSQRAANFL